MDLELQLKSDMNLLGNFIFSERKKLGLGKEKFGQLCGGLSETYIRNLEEGKVNITLKSLVKLKSGLKSTIAIIITRNKGSFSTKTVTLGSTEDFLTAKQNFSSRLFAIMKSRKLSSIEFSNYLGMDESATNKYLNNSENPTYLMLLRFAHVLKVEVKDFFDYAGPLPENKNYKPRYLSP
ncbi:MAG TPA: helix-turn-helix transcriptional regulator [Hanamia sp.]|nr:helix-turn-helix transcriptional regulator [Hanamia sp.]